MLLNISIQNWLSFKDYASFSMIASREKQHGDRIAHIEDYDVKVLPIAAIYGGNASGKTNLFKALNFARNLIVNGTRPESLIAVQAFKLDDESALKPSTFSFELLIDEKIFAYSFTVNKEAILEEKLVAVGTGKEKVLFHRVNGRSNFDKSLKNMQELEIYFKGTRDNQLFLTNSVSQKVETFLPVYKWFRDYLELVAPDSRFATFEHFLNEDHQLYSAMNEMLPKLDTGITHLGGEEIPFDSIRLPEALREKIREDVKEGQTIRFNLDPMNERFIVTRKDGELVAKKLIALHPSANGEKIKFELDSESDGSQRVIDLLPGFLELASKNSKKVYVIDELDRSLHTLMTRRLLETYLLTCDSASRSQLLFTTHDVLLMDQNLLRRDEMWVAERNQYGASRLISFSEYKDVRNDKNLQKSYLLGRLGGIPRLLVSESDLGGYASESK